MDVKEFRSNDSEKSGNIPRYPDEPAEGSVNYRVYGIIGVVAIAIIIIIALFVKANKFDIKEYIKPVYTGANGYASVTFVIDEEALLAKLSGKNPDSDRQYYVRKFIESLSAHTDAADIRNGDTINVVLEYNAAYADGAKAEIPRNEYSYKAKGITDGAMVDIYSGISVAFTGISPDARIIISNDWENDYLKTLTFKADKPDGIMLGDVIKVSCEESYEELARHGIIVRSMDASYTADMLSSYCESVDDINTDIMETIYDEIADTIRKETEDVTYRMLFAATGDTEYLYHLNEEKADNIVIDAAYFLKKNNENATDNNYIVVEASADVSDNEKEEHIYYMFVYNNAYLTIDGTFNVGHDNQNRRFACSNNEEKLYDEYVGGLKNNYTIDKIK